MTPLETRWGFLVPWCAWVRTRIAYNWSVREEEVWASPHRRLEVELPTRRDASTDRESGKKEVHYQDFHIFEIHFRKIRETLGLLAAVAHVDQKALRYLLENHCGVKLGKEGEEVFEEEIPVRFFLSVRDGKHGKEHIEELTEDLVLFCGTDQRVNPSPEFNNALKMIAELRTSGIRGVAIEIPVRVWFLDFEAEILEMEGAVESLEAISKAEQVIKESWENYERSSDKRIMGMKCTFVLEPMVADLSGFIITSELGALVEKMMQENVWFSHLSLAMYVERERMIDERAAKIILGSLMTQVFDSSRRSDSLANTTYCFNQRWRKNRPLQLGTIHLDCESTILPLEFEAMCSAMVLNQITRNVSMALAVEADDPITSARWWEWLAYAFFSDRARACSTLESLALIYIGSMSAADVEAFSAVLASGHPEEHLSGSPRGLVDEQDAVLKAGASIQWRFNKQGRPRRGFRALQFDSEIPFVRTFSDDGKSEWVDVLIPGYGRCKVKRADLVFNSSSAACCGSGGVTSLKIGFDKLDLSNSEGLYDFLNVVGPSLLYLTIDGPIENLNANLILENCPNLVELSLCTFLVDIRLNVVDLRANSQVLPPLHRYWHFVGDLASAIGNEAHPFSKCVRRVRVRLIDAWAGWDVDLLNYYPPIVDDDFNALLDMLKVNRSLEYLDVVVTHYDLRYLDEFRKYHLQPINPSLKLPIEKKIAFLSVLSPQREAPKSGKARRRTTSRAQPAICKLDHHVLSQIFAFASRPVLREVYLRHTCDDDWKEETIQVVI
ncbi:hypothetical protein PF002_g20994 [Phytophthora fragariae]|uniref:Uncharacterized protein n=1 Tax=Phytophthora fragariae TaxID=53985 RepID=A0A6A3J6H7_9STRA|nr:hypothetical protein PF011_g18159 [Phytophthora fragariae]KAE9089539.1 hypothetical protein PF007_g19559 [Phytophthora fragariae]KAE9203232.1 hypothetical protein PF002_g20994 [Phytophthora fragariae]KAE9316159.1 hypothetical protein PF008_g19079 [Phytophthora fragariae]